MLMFIHNRNDGPTDNDLKDGDIYSVYPSTYNPGSAELKKWLVIEVPDLGTDWAELTKSDYTINASGSPIVRFQRKYSVRYWDYLTPDEVIAVRDRTVAVPVMKGRFSLEDISRK